MRISDWSSDVCSSDLHTEQVEYHGHERLMNVRFIPELNWYLLVEKDETGAMAGIRNALYVNLAVCAVITGLVLLGIWLTISRFQRRSEEHTSELQSLMRTSYAVFCLKNKTNTNTTNPTNMHTILT